MEKRRYMLSHRLPVMRKIFIKTRIPTVTLPMEKSVRYTLNYQAVTRVITMAAGLPDINMIKTVDSKKELKIIRIVHINMIKMAG